MQRDRKTTYTLTDAEVREAVIDWLRKKGEAVADDAYLSSSALADGQVELVDHQVIADSPKS